MSIRSVDDKGDYYVGNDLLTKIAESLGDKSLQRVVIDIQFDSFVKVYTVSAHSGRVLRAIDIEDLMKGAEITKLNEPRAE